MKKVSLIFNIVLSLAVIALFILHFTSNKPKDSVVSSENGTEETTKTSPGDIVFIQVDSLIQNYDMFHDLSSEFNTKAQAIQDDLSKKGRAWENDAKNFQEKIQKGLLTTVQANNQQNTLAQQQEELRQLIQQREYELQEEEAVMYNRVIDAIQTYLTKYNETKKYALILTTSSSNKNVIVGQNSINITQEVLTGLNNEYISNKNRKK